MGSVALVDADKMEPVSGLDRPRLFAKWQGSQLDWKAIAKGIGQIDRGRLRPDIRHSQPGLAGRRDRATAAQGSQCCSSLPALGRKKQHLLERIGLGHSEKLWMITQESAQIIVGGRLHQPAKIARHR
ncbi:MAG: hypothetical protein CL819_01190, partial [Croceicoccus sp.]|nr:hypothetical protein [Croceicoccus sp.]